MKQLESVNPVSQNQYLSLFDTNIFSCSVFKYQSLNDYQACEKNSGSFVYVTLSHIVKDFFALTQEGFALLGTHSTYQLPALFFSSAVSENIYSIQTCATREQQLAMITYFAPILQSVSHYYHNPFTQHKSLELYEAWISNSFSGYADHYAFIDLGGIIAGFITLKHKQDFMSIDLLVVNPLMRSKGVGKTLINYAIRYAHDQQRALKVTTQGDNIPANRLYQKEGFLVVDQQHLFFKVEQ